MPAQAHLHCVERYEVSCDYRYVEEVSKDAAPSYYAPTKGTVKDDHGERKMVRIQRTISCQTRA